MEPTLVTETSEGKTQTPGKFPEESTLEFTLVTTMGANEVKVFKILTFRPSKKE
jgi:hypothetical protein